MLADKTPSDDMSATLCSFSKDKGSHQGRNYSILLYNGFFLF